MEDEPEEQFGEEEDKEREGEVEEKDKAGPSARTIPKRGQLKLVLSSGRWARRLWEGQCRVFRQLGHP